MRTFLKCSLALISFTAILSGRALQQPAQLPEDIEEVTVIGGKTLSQYRLELQQAQDELFKLFNEANESNDTDVSCRDEAPTGSRIPQRVCWSRAQGRAAAKGARDFLRPGSAADSAQVLNSVTQNAERDAEGAAVQFEDEWQRLMSRNQQFYEAVVKYGELDAEFNRLSGRTSAAMLLPRQILLGPAGPRCEASTFTEYEQRDNVASVSGTVSISACPAGTTGSFTLVANVRNEAGAVTPIEFNETWQRADAQDHVFESTYPIGDNVFLQSVRVRNLTCTCASPAH